MRAVSDGESTTERRRGRRWVTRLATVIVGAFALLTLVRLSGFQANAWPLSALLAFTPYGVASGVLLVVLGLWRRLWLHALVAAACTLALLAIVDPRTRPIGDPAEPRDGDQQQQVYGDQPPQPGGNPHASGAQITVMSLNTFWGAADFGQLAELVAEHEPDVIALQEVNKAGLAKLRAAGLLRTYSHAVVGGQRVKDEGVVLSRWPARAANLSLPSVYRPARVRIPGAGEVTVISAHPLPPVKPSAQKPWARWLAALPAPEQLGEHVIVAGDFNATVDHRQFRDVLDRGWNDVALQTGAGLRPTWHGLPLMRLTIDHILVPPEFGIRSYRVDRIDGSDHRVITARLRLPK